MIAALSFLMAVAVVLALVAFACAPSHVQACVACGLLFLVIWYACHGALSGLLP